MRIASSTRGRPVTDGGSYSGRNCFTTYVDFPPPQPVATSTANNRTDIRLIRLNPFPSCLFATCPCQSPLPAAGGLLKSRSDGFDSTLSSSLSSVSEARRRFSLMAWTSRAVVLDVLAK